MKWLPALLVGVLAAQVSADSLNVTSDARWYLDRYPFMNRSGLYWTLETEFTWPEGYHRQDSSRLTPFACWVSYIPLWHRDKAVNSFLKGRIYEASEISRAIQLKWRATRLTDYGIPIQLLAEYYLYHGRQDDLSFDPAFGKRLNYKKFRSGKVIFRPHEGVLIEPSDERSHSDLVFTEFVDLLIRESNYASLASNCDSVRADDLAPGDLLIGHDEKGLQGRVWVILNVIVNSRGGRRFVVGTGCPQSCAFYIPLFHDDRSNPWITLKELKSLAAEFPERGFFRLPVASLDRSD